MLTFRAGRPPTLQHVPPVGQPRRSALATTGLSCGARALRVGPSATVRRVGRSFLRHAHGLGWRVGRLSGACVCGRGVAPCRRKQKDHTTVSGSRPGRGRPASGVPRQCSLPRWGATNGARGWFEARRRRPGHEWAAVVDTESGRVATSEALPAPKAPSGGESRYAPSPASPPHARVVADRPLCPVCA